LKPILNAKDIKEYLGISLSLVYTMFRDPSFPVIHIGNRKLVKSEDFLKWLEQQKDNDIPLEQTKTTHYI
jgi:predicted DNA-binding transcriptional regulator AlpA